MLSVLRSLVLAPVGALDSEFQLAPVPVSQVVAPLSLETLAALEKAFEEIRAHIKDGRDFPTPETVREAATWLQDLVLKEEHLRQRGTGRSLAIQKLFFVSYEPKDWAPLFRFLARPELLPIHCVRLAFLVGEIEREGDSESFRFQAANLFGAYFRAHPQVGFREMSAAFAAAGFHPQTLAWQRLRVDSYRESNYGLPPGHIWPCYAEHSELLAQALAGDSEVRANAFRVLALFPTPPPALLHPIWAAALGKKSERALAQAAAERTPDRLQRLREGLQSRKAETRVAAAEWLGRLGEKSATEDLAKALARETDDAAQGALLGALEGLGESVEGFVGAAPLAKDAAQGLARGIPKEAQWFPLGGLPAVRWERSRQSVEPDSIRWLIVQAIAGRNPEPGTVLLRNAALFCPEDREALGLFVLTAWLAEDTAAIPLAEAEVQARESARAQFQWQQQFAQYAKSQNLPVGAPGAAFVIKTEEQLYQEAHALYRRQPKGSAIGSKGILAVAAACCGSAAVPVIGRYLKDWYGQRAAQCRALVQALAWMEHPTAIQLMLAVGGRFRTKSIQEEAAKQAQALAERKGWTLDELADRTVPSAGFDEAGELPLDYGSRQFTARLGPDFAVTLTNPDGKEISALPEPRQGDDESLAAQARKSLSAAKKELKSVLPLQRDRLYEAMCTQREWRFEDWDLFLNRHPILRHYGQRLVWANPRDPEAVRLFRPLPDGSLTDADDDPVTLSADDRVRLAHGSLLTPEAAIRWKAHLADYAVEPLFGQFPATVFTLPSERESEGELNDFLGHVLGAFRFRSRATKLGYSRGATQDGGWFYEYRRRFVALGIEAVIEFTGNSLPEEDRLVALRSLAFERRAEAGGGVRMPLGEVPAVLLTECWNDWRSFAAEGAGFDPDWETKCRP